MAEVSFEQRTGADNLAPAGQRPDNPAEPSRRMSDEDRAQLKRLQEQDSAERDEDTRPTEENATHTLALADGRFIPSFGGSITHYSENVDDDKGGKKEKVTPVIGVYAR